MSVTNDRQAAGLASEASWLLCNIFIALFKRSCLVCLNKVGVWFLGLHVESDAPVCLCDKVHNGTQYGAKRFLDKRFLNKCAINMTRITDSDLQSCPTALYHMMQVPVDGFQTTEKVYQKIRATGSQSW